MSSSTTMPPTSIPTSWSGSKNIDGLSSTSPRHPLPGSTPSRASLPSSQRRVSSAAYSDHCGNSKMPSTASSTTPTQTKTLYPDQGPQQNYRRCQTRAPSVRFDPLGGTIEGERSELRITQLQRHEGHSSPTRPP